MKIMKSIILGAIILSLPVLGFAVGTIDQALVNRLKGRIMLQVQQHGEAWYLDPVSGKRYYMKDGATAYQMLRQFGLGISDADLAKIPVGEVGSSATFTTYTNAELGYSVQYPSSWTVDEQRNSYGPVVMINPQDAEPFVGYLEIGIDPRTLEQILQQRRNSTDYTYIESQVLIDGQTAYRFSPTGIDSTETFVSYNGKIYLLSTNKSSSTDVQKAIGSFRFTK